MKRLKCKDLHSFLNMEDESAHLSREAISRHLLDCDECQELLPELSWLYGEINLVAARRERQSRRGKQKILAMAGSCLILVFGLWQFNLPANNDQQSIQPAAIDLKEEVGRQLPQHHYSFEVESLQCLPSRSLSSKLATQLGTDLKPFAEPRRDMEWIR